MIRNIIEIMRDMKTATGLSYPAVCEACEVEYPSFARWLKRYTSNKPVVSRPGPKKVEPFDMENLQFEINNLKHGKKRTAETGKLYSMYMNSISRRDFGLLVSMARKDVNREHEANLRRINWKTPGLVWSMDDTELGSDPNGIKLFEHMVMDLGSRYKFPPVFGSLLTGKRVAENLEKLFKKYGVPLFLKRDNHKNLNNKDVDEVLKNNFVIPLNSPEYYPPYNGSIEKGNSEFKACLVEKVEVLQSGIREHLQAYSETAIHELNHKGRECLRGNNSCQRFFNEKSNYRFTIKERSSIYKWINIQTEAILEVMKFDHYSEKEKRYRKAFGSAWRVAAETWMRMKGYIFVSVDQKVLPNFCLENYHK
jgi:transposase InsO family protein